VGQLSSFTPSAVACRVNRRWGRPAPSACPGPSTPLCRASADWQRRFLYAAALFCPGEPGKNGGSAGHRAISPGPAAAAASAAL